MPWNTTILISRGQVPATGTRVAYTREIVYSSGTIPFPGKQQ